MRTRVLFAVLIAGLFFIANRAAYRGFFADDDLDNIANARGVELSYYGPALIKPMIARDAVFRPVPDLYYYVMSRVAELDFVPYVAVIQIIHLVNVFLVWLLARRLGAEMTGAWAAAALFAFHASMMTIYWRPMYVFDLVCATFVLLTLLAYLRGWIGLSVVLFWLTMKSKELAIFLPVALTAYEWFFAMDKKESRRDAESRRGPQRLLRVAPFFAISALFGIWALVYNTGRNNDYSLRFAPAAVWTCVQFYASKLVLAPAWVGIAAVAAIVFFAGNRLIRIGLVMFFSLMAVLLVLPGRLYPAYLYTAFIGLAIAISAATRPLWLVIFFAFWIPWNYRQLRIDRGPELAAAEERERWVTPVAAFVRSHPEIDTFVYVNRPASMAEYGVTGTVRALRPNAALTFADADSPERAAAFLHPNFAVLSWNPLIRRMRILEHQPDAFYITLNETAPLWQLEEGWIDPGLNFRWIAPRATARLNFPAGATSFEVMTFAPDVYLASVHGGRMDVRLGGKTIGTVMLDNPEAKTYRFAIQGGGRSVRVEFEVSPPLKDPAGSAKLYGAPIMAFGFKQE